MKNRSPRGLTFCPGKFSYNSLGLLAAATIAATGSLQVIAGDTGSLLAEDAVIASESATTVSEQAAATLPALEKNVKESDPRDWQPPVAPVVAIPSLVDSEQAKELAEQWGVKLISLNLTSAGFMMDFRFRVLDATKAQTLFDHRIKPYVVAELSNAKLPVPMATKVGAMRPTNRGKNIVADKNYYMIFGNPDRHVKTGERVTMIIGDFKVEHLMVN